MAKYTLTKLVQALNKDEIKNFKIYSSRIKSNLNDKKSVQLFDLIKKEEIDEYSDEIIKKVAANNKNAYYRIKNRLIEDIEHSLLLLNRNKDQRFKINNWIGIARIFTYKSNYDIALSYLVKAENTALKFKFYDLANIAYDHIIELGNLHSSIPLATYVQKRNDSNQQYQQVQHFSSLLAIVKDKMHKTNFSGKDESVIETLNTIIEQLKFAETYQQSPHIQFQIYHCIRSVLIQKKDFPTLESYLINTLEDFNNKHFFKQANFHHEKIILLVWLINSLLKNKKIAQVNNYIEQLHHSLSAFGNLHYNKYIWLYHQSIVMLYGFSNQNQKAIELLEQLRNDEQFNANSNYRLFIFLNLVTHNYCEGNIEEALKHLSHIITSKWYDTLSIDFQLSCSILELIIRIETEDFDYIIYKVNNIKKNFRKQLAQSNFIHEKDFINILSQIAQRPEPFKHQRLLDKIMKFIENAPAFEPLSNEAINYQVWLRAKLNKQKYYDLILQIVRPDLSNTP